jgi:hypothetical protein
MIAVSEAEPNEGVRYNELSPTEKQEFDREANFKIGSQ